MNKKIVPGEIAHVKYDSAGVLVYNVFDGNNRIPFDGDSKALYEKDYVLIIASGMKCNCHSCCIRNDTTICAFIDSNCHVWFSHEKFLEVVTM